MCMYSAVSASDINSLNKTSREIIRRLTKRDPDMFPQKEACAGNPLISHRPPLSRYAREFPLLSRRSYARDFAELIR